MSGRNASSEGFRALRARRTEGYGHPIKGVVMTKKGQALAILIVSTLAFTVCFMVWMMFGVIGIPIKKTLRLNSTEFGLLTAMPVLSGSLIRVPLGIWTDRFCGRIVLAVLMAITVPAIWLMSYATAYWHFLVIGLFVGLAGGSFSVGTPYVARWFPRNQQGFAMGTGARYSRSVRRPKLLRPACGRSPGTSGRHVTALRQRSRCGGDGYAPADLCRGLAAIPAIAGWIGRDRGC
jgi:hypothetical protein